MSVATPRLQPLARDQWGDDVTAAFRRGFGDDVADRFLAAEPDGLRAPNALTTMMHHPKLAGAFLAYNNVLLSAPTLEPRWRELMVLRVAWRTRASYEWVQHVRLAQTCDVTADEIDAIALGAESAAWSDFESDLLAATDELIDQYRIDDATWARLAAVLDARQLVELLFVVGNYICLAMVFKSLELELDPDLDAVTAPALPTLET